MTRIKVLLSEAQIAARVAELGREITEVYRGRPLTVVMLLNGAAIFCADLLRRIELPLELDSFAVSSYENDCSTGRMRVRSSLKLPVAGREVLLVDDILDTGASLAYTTGYFREQGAAGIRVCVLMDKMIPDKHYGPADWTGFRIPDRYVVGYGLDSDERYRNLPYVGILQPERDPAAARPE